MSANEDMVANERLLQARIDIAGLQKTWAEFPDELREACALADVYVAMLPADVAPGVVPWTFPNERVKP